MSAFIALVFGRFDDTSASGRLVGLLDAWRAGDQRAGSRLFERHYKRVARFFRYKAAEREMADLIQKTFLGCVESLARFRGDASFKSFLLAIARNVLLMHYRTRRRRGPALDPGVTSLLDIGPTPHTLLARRDEARRQSARRNHDVAETLCASAASCVQLPGTFPAKPTLVLVAAL